MDVFSKCTSCYNELSEEEKENNAEYENQQFPLCDKCLEHSVDFIKKRILDN